MVVLRLTHSFRKRETKGEKERRSEGEEEIER
jgi:hypothetical protein